MTRKEDIKNAYRILVWKLEENIYVYNIKMDLKWDMGTWTGFNRLRREASRRPA
jgi:hypothetical protein